MKLYEGMRILARWIDKVQYPAVIAQIEGAKVLVRFPNGAEHWLAVADVTPAAP